MIWSFGALTTTVKCADAVFAGDWLSLAVTVTANVPAVLGVPLITPVDVPMARPEGRPLAVHV